MQTLNATEEQALLADIKTAVDLVEEQGLAPDAALAKVARDAGHGPGKIRLLGYAYNTGRQTVQRETHRTALDKLASFALVDPEAVVRLVYAGTKQAEAVHPDYLAPPDWVRDDAALAVKTARDHVLDTTPAPAVVPPERAYLAAVHACDRTKRAADAAAQQAADTEDQLQTKVARLVGYFRGAFPEDRLRFAVVAKAAADYYGPTAAALLELVHTQGRLEDRFGEKRAEAATPLRRPLDLDAAPFPLIVACVKLAHALPAQRTAAQAAAEKAAATRQDQMRPFTPAGPSPDGSAPALPLLPLVPAAATKAASLFSGPAMGAAMGSMVTRGLGGMPETNDDKVNDAWLKLEDPAHANTLRKIQAHAMLNSLMTDPDDPISGYDPDTVLEAYNDLAKLAPRAAQQPAAMGPILRRRLSGQFEPFESKEIAEIEKSLAGAKATTPNTGKLSYAPDKLRG